jgi:hypothetical protein
MPRTITSTTTGYTAAELRDKFPAAFEAAVERYTNFLWETGLIEEDLNYIYEGVFEEAGCPSLAGSPLRWNYGFSQGDGVSFDNQVLTYDNIKELGFEVPAGLEGDFAVVRDTGYIGSHYTHEYTFDVEYNDRFYIEDEELGRKVDELAAQLTEALRDISRKLYRAGSDYILDEEVWADRFLDGNDSLYDEDGDVVGDIADGEELA